MAKTCPNCGKVLKDTASFCGKCGKKWEDISETTESTPAPKNAAAFFAANKKWLIGVGALLLTVVLLLIIINPANSPKAVFDRYLDCLRDQNAQQMSAISYDAHFSTYLTTDDVVTSYKGRFAYADASFKENGKVNLLHGMEIKITKTEALTQEEIDKRRAELADSYRNTARITDMRKISFEVKQGENKSIGTAELICVTGKWYIGSVSGI